MALAAGSRLGPYEVLAPLGAGGMGEVYRARDVRLDRIVAIKSLPAEFAGHAERLARFEREARLLASLDHPNIAGIHGLEDVGGAPHLVLEFVEGETLAQRLARGPLSVRETLDVGAQIASAIEAAHERGIVHRDLKPGNVMLTPSGMVKVLDFGLARGAVEPGSSRDLSASPTVAIEATGEGVILGTAPYMSPEQARGRPVDRRADVWAFGCILFECLAGRPAFAGETVSDVVARILEREPDWSALPGATPARLRDLVRRCLTKPEAERPRDIGDLRRELGAIATELSAPAGAAVAAVPSLAVLYFENLAGEPESEYFCAGITEDILTDLSKIRGLRVASRNAVLRYRGSPVDIARVATELGVGAVLEGSVRRAGDRVRISAQLVNAADGFHLWAERYDRTLEDVFAVQEEIASSIAEALRVRLTPAETRQLVHDRPGDARAYDLYLKGRERYGRYTVEDNREALALFQQATALDPNYALAWAGIADCCGQWMQWGSEAQFPESMRLGLEAAHRALAINPRLAEGHKAEALVLRFAGDLDASRAALARAIEVNPRFTPAMINLAVDSASRADLAGAERMLRRAIEVDPQDAFATMWLIYVLSLTSREPEALTLAAHLRTLSNEGIYRMSAHACVLAIQLGRGDLVAAEQTVRRAGAEGIEAETVRIFELAIAAREGRTADARRLADEIGEEPLGLYPIALAAGALVRIAYPDRALRLLDRRIARNLAPTIVRLTSELHPLLDREPFAPRRMDAALVWPLEAPMMDATRHALFREVRIESGLSRGSETRAS